jgi:hypothetical protein
MAIIYSYPIATPELQDLLIGTEMAVQGGEDTPRTRTFTIQSIVELVETVIQPTPTLQQVTAAGPNTTLNITANSFIKSGGLGTEYLMANGTTTNSAGINNADYVRNTDDIYTATPKITQIVTLDAAQYAAATKLDSTLYIII